MPIKHTSDGKVEVVSKPRPTAEFNGRKYVLEDSITGDFALIKAYKGDEKGNLVFHLTARYSELYFLFIFFNFHFNFFAMFCDFTELIIEY